jgi:BirA family biotin operon repressor/biotin-[acetyl-CoA-carboxylase] ligase
MWLTPPGSGVCLSFGWTFPGARRDLAALTLAVGVAVRRALQSLGAIEIGLKWPNDLVVNGGKLGGILAEMRLTADSTYVVMGIGVNLDLPADFAAAVAALGGQPPQDLRRAGLSDVNAVSVAAVLIDQLCLAVPVYASEGFEPFRREWTEADILRDRCVEWVTGESRREGIARGIETDGTLLVEHAGGIERLVAGEVSLRRAA